MKLREVMTSQVEVIAPEATVFEAAERMDSLDIGAIPVCGAEKLRGLITDRDITVRVVAKGLDPMQVRVEEVMNSPIVYAYDDAECGEAARLMEANQVRRLVVVNRQKRLVGLVSLGDLAVRVDPALSGDALQKIADPENGQAA